MEFLLRVMKNTWLLPPERTDAKNTCRGRGREGGRERDRESEWDCVFVYVYESAVSALCMLCVTKYT